MSSTAQVSNTEKLDFEKVWLMFQETDKKFQETKDLLTEKFQETDKKFQETDKKFQETTHSFQETDKQFKETNRQMKNLLKKMSEAESRWGKFVESLVNGALVDLLTDIGIEVTGTLQREKKLYNGKQYEIDAIAKNGKDLVAVEVKTSLSPQDVDDFIQVLKIFKEVFPEYSDKNLIGAVGFINEEGKSAIYAENKGLLVIKATGASARIVNINSFKPKIW